MKHSPSLVAQEWRKIHLEKGVQIKTAMEIMNENLGLNYNVHEQSSRWANGARRLPERVCNYMMQDIINYYRRNHGC